MKQLPRVSYNTVGIFIIKQICSCVLFAVVSLPQLMYFHSMWLSGMPHKTGVIEYLVGKIDHVHKTCCCSTKIHLGMVPYPGH